MRILLDFDTISTYKCMKNIAFKNTFGWGFFLWFVGYALGIVLFMVAPPALIGWILTPIGTVITLWVLVKKIRVASLREAIPLSLSWTVIAVVCDYLFLVLVFKPADGYYKLDVYVYYALTFLLPLIVGFIRSRPRRVLSVNPQ